MWSWWFWDRVALVVNAFNGPRRWFFYAKMRSLAPVDWQGKTWWPLTPEEYELAKNCYFVYRKNHRK